MDREFSSETTYVLGVYLGHDLGACLLKNGQIHTMIEEERLNRYKHGRPNSLAGLWPTYSGRFGYFPWASVSYCLRAAGISIDDVDLIAVGDDIWGSGAADTIHDVIPVSDPDKVLFIREPANASHHYHHALSAFFASPFESAAVLVIDADGSENADGYEAESGYHFEDRSGSHRPVFKNRYENTHIPRSGIGWTYEHVTQLIGFTSPDIYLADAGKTMGLASYGLENEELKSPWITARGFELDFSGFHRWLQQHGHVARLEDLCRPKWPLNQFTKDVAFKVQRELENSVFEIASELHHKTGEKRLCIAGGVGLNSVANTRLLKEGPFEQIFVQPAAYDGGQALGLAYHGHLILQHRKTNPYLRVAIEPMRNAYTGRVYSIEEILRQLGKAGLPYTQHDDLGQLVNDAAERVSQGKVIGWFQGGSEAGPRALGHRSIIAHPGIVGMQDHVNARVKFREGFRPFAPAVLAERSQEIFDFQAASDYMLFVAPVRDDWQRKLPAITHVDGTARLQTVSAKSDEPFYALISEFDALTGIPVLLNTSFNLRGMPIVETPYDALLCFLFTELDHLFLGNVRVDRPSPTLMTPFWVDGWTREVISDVENCYECLRLKNLATGKTAEFTLNAAARYAIKKINGERSVENIGVDSRFAAFMQDLLRSGALGLRLGRETFVYPGEELHWWQMKRSDFNRRRLALQLQDSDQRSAKVLATVA